MENSVGASLTSIHADGCWHSGSRANGDPLGKISYITVQTEKGLLVRYRSHKQGVWHVWRSWSEGVCGIHLKSSFLAQKTAQESFQKGLLSRVHQAWKEGESVDPNHPYLQKKLIKPVGIKAASKYYSLGASDKNSAPQYIKKGTLLVPAYSNEGSVVVGYETISLDGRKLMRGRKSATHLPLGLKALNSTSKNISICIAEGYSTAVSIFMRKSIPCFAVFSVSNLMNTGLWLSNNYPEANIIFAADNDIGVYFNIAGKRVENPGAYYAREAADAIGAKVCLPNAINNKKTDWNDLHVYEAQLSNSLLSGSKRS